MSSRITILSSTAFPLLIFVFLFNFFREGWGEGTGYLLAAFLFLFLYGWRPAITIGPDTISRKLFLFKIGIRERMLKPEDIEEIRFRRAGWARKKAVLVTRQRTNLWIGQAEDEVMEHLESFAERHDIQTDYAKEYKWL